MKSQSQNSMPFEGGVDVSNKDQVMTYLAKFNAGLADVQSGIMASGFRKGMAGHERNGHDDVDLELDQD